MHAKEGTLCLVDLQFTGNEKKSQGMAEGCGEDAMIELIYISLFYGCFVN